MKKLLLFIVAFTSSLFASAYDACVNGIYYNLDSTNKTASVTNSTGDYRAKSYSDNVSIPIIVTFDDVEYSVTSIGCEAFFDCSNLTSVTIGNSVSSIGQDAFYN